MITCNNGNHLHAMHVAARTGNVHVMKFLLSRDPTLVNARNPEGYTPLHLACRHHVSESIDFLLTVPGVDVNAKVHGRVTPMVEFLDGVVRNEHVGAMLNLLRAGAETPPDYDCYLKAHIAHELEQYKFVGIVDHFRFTSRSRM